MGESDRSKKAGQINSRLDNYTSPYGGKDYMANIDKYFKMGKDNINKSFTSDINRNTGSVAQRLAGQGVTGGATLEDSIKASNNPIYAKKAGALDNLETGHVGAQTDAMDTFNKLDLDKIMMQLRGAGLLSDSNTFDDIFSGLNAGANIASKFIKPL